MKYISTHSEKNIIRLMHEGQKTYDNFIKESRNLYQDISDSFVITDWVSPDDRYVIFFDELYDLKSKEKLGDIWENFDYFKLFISHSFEVTNNVPEQIKESVRETLKTLLITESKIDLRKLKPFIKQTLNEEGFVDWIGSGIKKTGQWASDEVKRFGTDAKALAVKGIEGAKSAVSSISKGDWTSILDLLSKGMLFVARKIRSLLYNPVGIVLDSILIATGIGKSVQWIPWAIIVALDLYEISSGDYENKDMAGWLRWLMVGTDVLGLVFAGGVAGSARAAFSVFKNAKNAEQLAAIAAKNPRTVSFIQKIISSFSKVPELLGKAATYLKSTKLSKASPWIQGILGKAEGILKNGVKSLSEITGSIKAGSVAGKVERTAQSASKVKTPVSQIAKKGFKAGLKTAGVVTVLDKGIKKGMQLYAGKTDAEMEAAENMLANAESFKEETGMSIEDAINNAYK